MDMNMSLQMETEENMFHNSFAEYNEENEYPHQEMFYETNQSSVHEDVQIMQHSEESQPTQQQTQTSVQSLYKLKNIDTEASIKTELKQLISTKISEEINSKILNDTTYEVEEQITSLKTRTDSLQNKIQELDKEIESDANRLAESEFALQQTDEVIGLLQENVDKLSVLNRESRMNEISEKSLQQHENLEILKKMHTTKIDKEKEYLENMKTAIAKRNEDLKLEVSRKEEVLKGLKKRQEELKKVIETYDDEIKRNATKKRALENKLASVISKRRTLENDFVEQNDTLNKLFLKDENLLEKLNEINAEKKRMEEHLEQALRETEDMKTSVAQKEDQIVEKQKELNVLKDHSKTMRSEFQNSLKQLQRDRDCISEQLNEKDAILAACGSRNDQLLTDLSQLKNKYIQKCEEKLEWINRNLEQQNAAHKLNLELLQKQMEEKVKRAKFEDLQNRHETTLKVLNSLENDIKTQRETSDNELTQIKLKFELTRTDYDKYFLELRKKKEYLLANSEFLKEKSDNLRREVNVAENLLQTANKENASVQVLLENKLKQLEACKSNLNALKNSQGNEAPLKSGLKSPKNDNVVKKVQFNDILSFKSPTSSELSNVPGETPAQLETSFQDWWQNTKTSDAADVEIIDEEF